MRTLLLASLGLRRSGPVAVIFGTVSAVLLLMFSATHVEAASLTNAMVRLDRMSANTAVGGLICAQPSSPGAGNEGRIRVTFPSDFSLSTSTTNWTTSTSGLPSGTTAWPGISSTALNVSGNTVTFASNDLSSSTTYCFTFTGASSTTGASGTKTGNLTTTTSGGVTIDTKDYAVSVGDDGIGVTALVPADPADFTASMHQIGGNPLVGQGQDLEYELTYTSHLSYGTSIEIETNWSLGTIKGDTIPTVETVEYVTGSASLAHSNAPPVIDLINRKITWTIPFFPGGATKSVRFKVRSNDSYKGSDKVTFTVNGRILPPGTATSYSSVTTTYLYGYEAPYTGPTYTPAPQKAVTPTPTPNRTQPVFSDISIRTLNQDGGVVVFALNTPGTVTVAYGTSPSSLTRRITSLVPGTRHVVTLPELLPDTDYYFRATIQSNGLTTSSDLMVFHTAKTSTAPKIIPDTFIATSEKNLIFTFLDKAKTDNKNIVIIPPNTTFETQFAFEDTTSVKSVRLVIRDKDVASTNANVLGLNNFVQEADAEASQVSLLEIKPNVFVGRLQSFGKAGFYEIVAIVNDFSGNLTEEKLSELKVSKPFTLYRKDNNDPVEGARITLSLFNEKTRIYEQLSQNILPVQSIIYSEEDGSVPVVLPPGKYRAEINVLGFDSKTTDFTLGFHPQEDYPQIALYKQPFTPLYGIQYIAFIARDLALSVDTYVHGLGTSKRIYNFTAFVVLSCFFYIVVFSLSQKSHVRMRHLPRYFLSLLKLSRLDTEKESHYLGYITDGNTKKPLQGVDIFVANETTGKIIFHCKSNTSGNFKLAIAENKKYVLNLEKVGYNSATVHLHYLQQNEEQHLAMLVDTEHLSAHEALHRMYKKVLNVSFEVTLLLSIGAALLLCFTIGFLPVLPFLLLALFNICFWLLHSIHLQS